MIQKNNLKTIQSGIDRMVTVMKYVDESQLSTASIVMLANAVNVISSQTSDLFQLYLWYVKKHGDEALDFLKTNIESVENITKGLERLSKFMDRLSHEIDTRNLLLK